MKESKEILLALIRSAMWGDDLNGITQSPKWSEVLNLAQQQTLLGLIAEVIPSLPSDIQPEKKDLARLHFTVTRIYQSHSLLNRKVAEVKRLMDQHGIHCVLFKGQGIALNYPNPLSRQCGDIDLYVGDRNFLNAMNVLEPGVDHNVGDYKHMKHSNVESEGVHIELHRIAEMLPGARQDRMFKEWTVEQLEESDLRIVEIGGTSVNLPPVSFDPLYIMNHAWHHFLNGGIGLRQLCDWSMYLHRFHKDIDTEQLEYNLKRFSLYRAWQIMASLVVRHLGLPAEECPLYTGEYDRQGDMMIEEIWKEGNFGRHSSRRDTPRPKGHFAGKFHSFRMNTSRYPAIFKISPIDAINTWIYYVINGMKNVFVRVK